MITYVTAFKGSLANTHREQKDIGGKLDFFPYLLNDSVITHPFKGHLLSRATPKIAPCYIT